MMQFPIFKLRISWGAETVIFGQIPWFKKNRAEDPLNPRNSKCRPANLRMGHTVQVAVFFLFEVFFWQGGDPWADDLF